MKTASLDLRKEYKTYYSAKTTPEIIELGEAQYLSLEGQGSPGGKEYTAKMKALYALAYEIKMSLEKEGKDFTVAPLEGLGWVDSDRSFLEVPSEEWRWKLLIRQPESVTSEVIEKAKEEIVKKKGIELAKEIRLEKINEGKCVQILHVGSYSNEPESWAKIKKLMEEKNLMPHGLHHGIFLTDPMQVPEEKWKTILRQPVRERR